MKLGLCVLFYNGMGLHHVLLYTRLDYIIHTYILKTACDVTCLSQQKCSLCLYRDPEGSIRTDCAQN